METKTQNHMEITIGMGKDGLEFKKCIFIYIYIVQKGRCIIYLFVYLFIYAFIYMFFEVLLPKKMDIYI